MTEPARVLVNGVPGAGIDPLDRGLAYGDGLFESLRIADGRVPLWERHLARLAEGCRRLGIPNPDASQLSAEVSAAAAGLAQAAVRIVLTRGVAGRGYAPPSPRPAPGRIVAAFALPAAPEAPVGLRLRWCRLRLAEQPALAGLKHLNRLEQVLARAEWDDPETDEGLLRDARGRVIGATSANLFIVRGGIMATPAVDRCGVAGVARAEILARWPACEVRELEASEVMEAEEVFLSNAVRGVRPVVALDGRRWAPGPVARGLAEHWRGLFASGGAA